jgi:SAM-dependent methyltransferase
VARPPLPAVPAEPAEAVDRVIDILLASMDLAAIELGRRLGWYAALSGGAPATCAELAARVGSSPRYTREWCEQQAASGLLLVEGADGPEEDRRYALPDAVAQVLADGGSSTYLTPMVRQVARAIGLLPRIAEAARTGEGLGWAEYGQDMLEGQAESNRNAFLADLPTWIDAMPDVAARLHAGPSRIADIGCGAGWSSIGLARAYPGAAVDAYDIDAASVEMARRNVLDAGLAGRVRVLQADAGTLGVGTGPRDGPYDLLTAFECVHDLPDPVGVLAAMRAMTGPHAAVLVADEAVRERFSAPAGRLERLMYGISLLVCLPDSMSTSPSVATGTVMRPPVLRRYAEQAGYASVEVLDVEHDIWRFYRLHP